MPCYHRNDNGKCGKEGSLFCGKVCQFGSSMDCEAITRQTLNMS